jgi:hypothetical protein
MHNATSEPIHLDAFEHIIPLGDHCATALSLNTNQQRNTSYPFDWTSGLEGTELVETILHKNFAVLKALLATGDSVQATQRYLGDALQGSKVFEGVRFPHELRDGETAQDATRKYERRFARLHEHIVGQHKNLYCVVTRLGAVLPALLYDMVATLAPHHPGSRFLVISGLDHPYLHPTHAPPQVMFHHIPYLPHLYYSYDYTHFRPSLDAYLASLSVSSLPMEHGLPASNH